MDTTVYIIRHGRTLKAEEKRYYGYMDVPLSKTGQGQLQQLARYLKKGMNPGAPLAGGHGGLLDDVYCSDLVRATVSAEIIAEPFGLKPIVIPNLKERGFGHWEGLTFDEIHQQYAEEIDAWANDPLKFSPAGGESTVDVRNRVMAAFNDIMNNNNGKKIAVVAHGGVNRIIMCELLGISLQNIFRIEQDFGALNVFVFCEKVPVMKLMNYVVNPG